MTVSKTNISGLLVIDIEAVSDERGSFSKVFQNNIHSSLNKFEIKQVNISENIKSGTVRGMHLQKGEYGDSKIVFCLTGKLVDVCIDLRKSSKTFLQIFSVTLSEHGGKCLYIPHGVAHGFQTLQDDTNILYLHDNMYAPDFEDGVSVFDQAIMPHWKTDINVVSKKDGLLPSIIQWRKNEV
jgi:dTDP-4-dehydrorhamnose 3,5-epimerase